MSSGPCPVIVFAKAPVPGQVKTRLIPLLGESGAACLHERLAWHSLDRALHAGVGPVMLWCSPSTDHPFFRHCSESFQVSLHPQRGRDLGERMAQAFRETLNRADAALLMGTDSPNLTVNDLREASLCLHQNKDAVIGPAEDGGYVLIGLRRFAPELFTDISWGTHAVLEQTRDRFLNLGWEVHELSPRWDVDRPEDVERLKREGYAERFALTDLLSAL